MKGPRIAQDGPRGRTGPLTRPRRKRLTGRPWKRIRAAILRRDKYTCQDCGGGSVLEVHHIVPVREGGSDHPDNLTTLCVDCHRDRRRGRRKRGRPDREAWRAFAGY